MKNLVLKQIDENISLVIVDRKEIWKPNNHFAYIGKDKNGKFSAIACQGWDWSFRKLTGSDIVTGSSIVEVFAKLNNQ